MTSKQILTTSSIARILTRFFIVLLAILALPIAHDLGMSFGEVISLSVLATILFGVGSLPAGWLADRWSIEGMMVIFFVGLGFSGIMVGLAQTPLELMITLGFVGLFASIDSPVGTAWIFKTALNKGKALGINSWAGNFGAAAAALVAGILVQAFSWRAAFIVPSLMSIVMGVILFVLMQRKGLTRQPQKKISSFKPQFGMNIKNHRPLIILTILMVGSGLIYQALITIFPSVVFERFQSDGTHLDLTASFWISLTYIIAGSAHLVGGYLIDRYSPKAIYFASYTLLIPFLLLATSLGGVPFWVIITMCLSFHLGATPAEKMMVAEFAPKERRATALGTRFTIGVGLGALGTPLVGFIYDLSGGFYWVLITISVLAGAVAAVSLLLPPNKSPAKDLALKPQLAGAKKDLALRPEFAATSSE